MHSEITYPRNWIFPTLMVCLIFVNTAKVVPAIPVIYLAIVSSFLLLLIVAFRTTKITIDESSISSSNRILTKTYLFSDFAWIDSNSKSAWILLKSGKDFGFLKGGLPDQAWSELISYIQGKAEQGAAANP